MAISQMIGAKIHRREDPRLITGNGRFVEDLIRPGAVVHGRRAEPAPARAHHAHQHHPGAGACPAWSPCSPRPTSSHC